ncbi:MAG TPA: hypothetical protein VIL96_04195 [Gaiellaceae bacterium]
MRIVVAFAVACVLGVPSASAGWIQIPPKRPCPSLPEGYVCSTTTQIRFGYPGSWGALTSSDGGLIVRSLIWLSTEPLQRAVQGLPVSSLRPNGIVVRWSLGGLPGSNLDNVPGVPTVIGGWPARIDVLTNGPSFESCSTVGGDEVIVARAKRPRGSGFYYLWACLRGPDLATLRLEVANVLASARFPLR